MVSCALCERNQQSCFLWISYRRLGDCPDRVGWNRNGTGPPPSIQREEWRIFEGGSPFWLGLYESAFSNAWKDFSQDHRDVMSCKHDQLLSAYPMNCVTDMAVFLQPWCNHILCFSRKPVVQDFELPQIQSPIIEHHDTGWFVSFNAVLFCMRQVKDRIQATYVSFVFHNISPYPGTREVNRYWYELFFL